MALVAVLLLSMSVAVVSAQGITTTVTKQGGDVIIDIDENGEPLKNATVEVRGVGESTELDGKYSTGKFGRVVFGSDVTKNLSGVVDLRVDVRSENTSTSDLKTIITPPRAEDRGSFGVRLSKALSDTASRTYGKVEGNMLVTRVNTDFSGPDGEEGHFLQIGLLRNEYRTLLRNLEDVRWDQRSNGRRMAMLNDVPIDREGDRQEGTGGVAAPDIYMNAIQNSAKKTLIRAEMFIVLDKLRSYPDEELERQSISPFEVEQRYHSLRKGNPIDFESNIQGF